jgi:hypothetical protein
MSSNDAHFFAEFSKLPKDIQQKVKYVALNLASNDRYNKECELDRLIDDFARGNSTITANDILAARKEIRAAKKIEKEAEKEAYPDGKPKLATGYYIDNAFTQPKLKRTLKKTTKKPTVKKKAK